MLVGEGLFIAFSEAVKFKEVGETESRVLEGIMPIGVDVGTGSGPLHPHAGQMIGGVVVARAANCA